MNYANKLTGLNLKRSFEALVQLTEGARIPDGSAAGRGIRKGFVGEKREEPNEKKHIFFWQRW